MGRHEIQNVRRKVACPGGEGRGELFLMNFLGICSFMARAHCVSKPDSRARCQRRYADILTNVETCTLTADDNESGYRCSTDAAAPPFASNVGRMLRALGLSRTRQKLQQSVYCTCIDGNKVHATKCWVCFHSELLHAIHQRSHSLLRIAQQQKGYF